MKGVSNSNTLMVYIILMIVSERLKTNITIHVYQNTRSFEKNIIKNYCKIKSHWNNKLTNSA